jgi:hypothetical protein
LTLKNTILGVLHNISEEEGGRRRRREEGGGGGLFGCNYD